MRTLRSWRFWIGLAISLVCLWLALRNVPLSHLGAALARTQLVFLPVAIVCQVLSVMPRAKRWQALLDQKGIFKDAFWAHGIGFLFTNVFPLRMGEPARALALSSRTGIPLVRVAATVIVERILDVASILVCLVLILPYMNVPPLVSRAGTIFGLIVVVALVGLWLVVRFRGAAESIVRAILRRARFLPEERLLGWWQEGVEGMAPLTRPAVALQVVMWSVASWVLSITVYWLVLRSIQPLVTVIEPTFMVVALALAVSVPSSPGFIGVYQYIGQQALVLPFAGKYDASSALAITLIVYLIYYLTTTILGVIGLWRFGESFARLGQRVMRRQPE
jgi:uncharacterized protein (TIRG00374 family)